MTTQLRKPGTGPPGSLKTASAKTHEVHCVSCDRIDNLEEQVVTLNQTMANLEETIDRAATTVESNASRISRLEAQLTENTLFFVEINRIRRWFDVYSNQSGRDVRVGMQLVCNDGSAHCIQGASQTSVRVLRILEDENELIEEFPIIENTVVVDTGPLDLSAVGAVRELVVPRGFRIVARTNYRSDVRLRVFVSQ